MHDAVAPAVNRLKSAARAVLGSPLALHVVRAVGPRRAAILMMHRFADPALGGRGTVPTVLRATLARLRKSRVTLLSTRDLLERIEHRTPLAGPTAVFTVDDGYQDFATVAAPVLAEFDCPVTVFVVSRFVDGTSWCWWDRIECAFLASPRREVTIQVAGREYRFELADLAGRRAAAAECTEVLKRVPDAERRRVVDAIGSAADAEVPDLPPPQYSAMSWADVRRLESELVSFGPHTRHHPILSQVSDATAQDEIAGAWADVRRECRNPVPVFCYPNGTFDAYGDREMQLIRESGLAGALAVYNGYVEPQVPSDARFRLPRFPFSDDPTTTAFQASGLARVAQR